MARKFSDYFPDMKGDNPLQMDIPIDLGDLLDANGNEILEFDAVASAVNQVRVANSAASSGPTLSSAGDDTNIDLNIAPKGTGGVNVTSTDTSALAVGANGATNPVLQVDANTASVATGIKLTGAAAGSNAAVAAISSGTNEGLTINAKGSGILTLQSSATGKVSTPRAITSTSATGGIGYATGAGGAVTQASNKSTGVTLNTVTGAITMNNAALNAGTEVGFTVTDSAVAATDVIILNIASGATADSYLVGVDAVAAGSFRVTVTNTSAGNLSEAIVINFAVIKGVAA